MKLASVDSWHEALNAGDADRVARMSTEHVEIHGPRGVARGRDVMRAWAAGAGVRLVPTRWFCGADDEVVIAQRATWAQDDGGFTEPVTVATAFRVRDGLIGSVARFDDLGDALASLGLGAADEVAAGAARRTP
jgi:hypothetical protein